MKDFKQVMQRDVGEEWLPHYFRKLMSAQAHIPTQALAEYCSLIWELNAPGAVEETILPRGIVEIIFQFEEPVVGTLPHQSEAVAIPRCFIQGFNTHVIRGRYPGRQHLLGIQLRAHRVRDLLGVLPSEFRDCAVDLTLIRTSFRDLWERLAEAPSFDARVQILYSRLPVLTSHVCPRKAQLNSLLMGDGADAFASVDALSRTVCYSTRQLGRVAKQVYGLPPETLATYKKFMEAVKAMHRSHSTLTSIAYEAGFFDQAHFTRTFRSLSGMTPKEYRQRRSNLPFHIY